MYNPDFSQVDGVVGQLCQILVLEVQSPYLRENATGFSPTPVFCSTSSREKLAFHFMLY